MADKRSGAAAAPSGKRFVVEWLALSALMAAPYVILDITVASIVLVVMALGYPVALAIKGYLAGRGQARPDRWLHFYASLYLGSGATAAVVLIIAASIGWLAVAYDFDSLFLPDADAIFSLGVRVTVAGALLAALFYWGALVLLRRRGALPGGPAEWLRAELSGIFRSPVLAGFAVSMALVGLLSTVAAVTALESLADNLLHGQDATILDVVIIFPFIPLGFFATTALLIAAQSIFMDTRAMLEEIRSHLSGGEAGRPGRPVWRGLVTVSASLVVISTWVYPIHFGMVAALSTVAGISHWNAASEGVVGWIAAQRETGRDETAIAADLNAEGYWTAAAPEAGLAALLPDFAEEISTYGGADNTCRIDIAAGLADPATLAGIDWMPVEQAGNGLKYCLRVACPSPVTWQAPPALLLSSSHPSRNRFWIETVYLDVFADGRAVEPGGYCTAAGGLAENFQG